MIDNYLFHAKVIEWQKERIENTQLYKYQFYFILTYERTNERIFSWMIHQLTHSIHQSTTQKVSKNPGFGGSFLVLELVELFEVAQSRVHSAEVFGQVQHLATHLNDLLLIGGQELTNLMQTLLWSQGGLHLFERLQGDEIH